MYLTVTNVQPINENSDDDLGIVGNNINNPSDPLYLPQSCQLYSTLLQMILSYLSIIFDSAIGQTYLEAKMLYLKAKIKGFARF